jgi:hypothetical protein
MRAVAAIGAAANSGAEETTTTAMHRPNKLNQPSRLAARASDVAAPFREIQGDDRMIISSPVPNDYLVKENTRQTHRVQRRKSIEMIAIRDRFDKWSSDSWSTSSR